MQKVVAGTAPLHEQIREQLLEQIQTGILKEGVPLPPERMLAEQLGASRHTVRQALSSLEALGLIEIRHGSGIYPTKVAPDDAVIRVAESMFDREGSAVNVIEARRGIEPYAARLAAERRTDEDLLALERITSPIGGEGDMAAGIERSSFHLAIAKATGNPVYHSVMRTLVTGPRRAEAYLEVIPSARQVWESEHMKIFMAIRDGDGAAAERLMVAHMETVNVDIHAARDRVPVAE